MSVRYSGTETFKDIRDSVNKILIEIFDSDKTYEINIREEKINDTYENIDIKIRKISDYE